MGVTHLGLPISPLPTFAECRLSEIFHGTIILVEKGVEKDSLITSWFLTGRL